MKKKSATKRNLSKLVRAKDSKKSFKNCAGKILIENIFETFASKKSIRKSFETYASKRFIRNPLKFVQAK